MKLEGQSFFLSKILLRRFMEVGIFVTCVVAGFALLEALAFNPPPNPMGHVFFSILLLFGAWRTFFVAKPVLVEMNRTTVRVIYLFRKLEMERASVRFVARTKTLGVGLATREETWLVIRHEERSLEIVGGVDKQPSLASELASKLESIRISLDR